MLYIDSDFCLCYSFEYSVHCPPGMKPFFDRLEISYHLNLAIYVYQKTGKQRSALHGHFAFFHIAFQEGCNNMQRLSLGIPVKIEMIINSKCALDYGKSGKARASLFPSHRPPRAFPSPQSPYNTRELKHQRRRRLRKRHLKSEFPLPQTLSRLTPSRLIRQMFATSFGVEF